MEYDKNQYLKRVKAFEQTIFPSCALRVMLQRDFHFYDVIPGTINPVIKMYLRLVKKIIINEDAKAFYQAEIALLKFLKLIKYDISKVDVYINELK